MAHIFYLEDAKQLAAALGFVGLVNSDRVVVEAFNDRLTQSMPPLRGRRSLWRMLNFLDKVEPAGPSDMARALRSFSLKCSGKGVVVLISDFMDKGGYEDALRYLIARQLDIYVLQVLSQEEIERIITEAEHMAESDRSQRDRVDLQNKLASLVKNTQRTFLEFGGLLEAEQQEAGQRILSEGEAALKSDEMGELRMSIDAVERLGRQLTSAMMKQPGEENKKED